jgi:alpha-1,3-rhamnosyltransferase
VRDADVGGERPLVSVLMPACNHESFVADSIRSVCAQTYRPLELIVVDDGSSDTTPAVVERLADDARAQLDRFVFRTQRNRGIAKTLNRALEDARGEFVATIDSDDVYLPHNIEFLVGLPEWDDPRTAVVFGDAVVIDEHGCGKGLLEDHSVAELDAPGAETSALAHYLRWRTPPEPGPLGSYASLLRGPYIPTSSTLIRRSALGEVGDYDESLFVEDYGLWLRLARKHRIVAVPDVVAEKRIHGNNVSLVQQRHVFRDMLELMVREKAHARSDPVAEAERLAARDRTFRAVRIYGTTGDLLRVLVRHPLAGPRDLLDARRAAASMS